MCERERGPVKNPSPHLHNFRIIPFIIVLEVMGALSGTIKSDSASPTASHRYNVSSELCCPHAKLEMGLATRNTLRRNTACIVKI